MTNNMTETKSTIDNVISEHEKAFYVLWMIKKATDYMIAAEKCSEMFPLLNDLNSHWRKRAIVYKAIIARLEKYYMSIIMEISFG